LSDRVLFQFSPLLLQHFRLFEQSEVLVVDFQRDVSAKLGREHGWNFADATRGKTDSETKVEFCVQQQGTGTKTAETCEQQQSKTACSALWRHAKENFASSNPNETPPSQKAQ
jgi:hypothetical protein